MVTAIHLRCLRTDSGEGDPSPGSLRASRLDFVGRLDDKLERTPQGGMRIPAALTRVGVFAYRNADGSTRKEYRPAEEVFRADSLASLRGAPVTDLHPQVFVSPDNYKTLSVGHVGDEVRQDGRHVRASLYVQDKGVLDAVLRRDRKEISCGYSMRWDPTPGVFEGERYDGVQRDIVYNHVALGPANWGRAGRDVALRLDSQVSVQTQETTTMLIKINGIEYDTSTPAFAQAYDAEQKRKDDLLSAANDTIGKLSKDKESATARADSAEAALKDERDPLKRAKAVEARASLESSARTLHGKPELKFDGKTDAEVKREALLAVPRLAALVEARKVVDPKLERSDDYLSALFDAETARATSQGSNHQHVQDAITPKVSAQQTQVPAYVAPHERPLSYSRK